MYDYMFRNALVADGSGGELYKANVAVFGDRIAFIGKEGISRARTVIDADGLLLTPGFIDMHTHTDLEVLRNRDMKPRLHQGILTDVSGNCGIGVFPNSGECLHTAVEDVLGTYDRWSWKSFSDYRALLESEGMGINEAFLVSHTALRYAAMGPEAGRAADDDEIQRMCAMLDGILADGAYGFSSGLYYSPCLFADRRELLALLRVVRKHDKLFAVHHRCEGNDVLQSLREVLDLAGETGVRLEISHLKAIGRANQAAVPRMLEMLEEARAAGIDVKADQYPYAYGSTSLFSLLPPHLLGLSRIEQRLALSLESERDELMREIMEPSGWDSVYQMAGPDDITAMFIESHQEYNGMTLSEIGEARGEKPLDALFDLLADETGLAVMSDVTQSDDSLRMIMRHPLVSFGTDSLYSSPMPHPRSFHSSVEYLGRYVMKEHVLSIEDAIRRMTGENAMKLGLKNRGFIREGYVADLLLINPSELGECGSGNTGFSVVMVSGKPVLIGGVWSYQRSGKVL